MRKVHRTSAGEPGVILQLGDSITYSMAFFAPLEFANPASLPPAAGEAWQTLDGYVRHECYRWKGAERGNGSGTTAEWALERVDDWIDQLRPQIAVIMFGTNDLRQSSLEQHQQQLRSLVQHCLDQGVVIILTTIPPMHGFEEEVQLAVEAQRRIADELNVPLIDLHAHILQRRPNDWDGAQPEFASYELWEVPTIISQDGVHLSNPRAWQMDFTEEGLRRNGNTLRNYLTLMACAEVIDVVIENQPPSEISHSILGVQPSAGF